MKKIISNIILLAIPVLVFCISASGDTIRLGNMDCTYEIKKDRLQIILSAPTEGWLAVGFNNQNSIKGADLLMFCVKGDEVIFEDQFVHAAGKHPEDSLCGGESNIRMESAAEESGRTIVEFSIPLSSGDKFGFVHQTGQDFWLILTYSVSDDFDHHSIMRKHIKTRWK
jgi:hypothetical protein